jgi:hypothetical protein
MTPNRSLDVLVGTSSGLFTLGDTEKVDLEGRDVVDITISDEGLWAVVGNSVLNRSRGGKWTEVTVPSRRANCILPTPHGVFVGADQAQLFVLAHGNVEPALGFDEAPGRDHWFTPWGGPPDVRSMALSGTTVYVNVHVGGILRSEDGASWKPTIDIRTDVHEVLSHNAELLAATAYGLAVSHDGGESWEVDDDGLDASYARAVAVAADEVLITASQGPWGGRAGIYRRPLAGTSFEKVHQGLPEWFPDNIDTGCLAAAGEVVAFGTVEGDVYLSDDAGSSWMTLANKLPEVRVVGLD